MSGGKAPESPYSGSPGTAARRSCSYFCEEGGGTEWGLEWGCSVQVQALWRPPLHDLAFSSPSPAQCGHGSRELSHPVLDPDPVGFGQVHVRRLDGHEVLRKLIIQGVRWGRVLLVREGVVKDRMMARGLEGEVESFCREVFDALEEAEESTTRSRDSQDRAHVHRNLVASSGTPRQAKLPGRLWAEEAGKSALEEGRKGASQLQNSCGGAERTERSPWQSSMLHRLIGYFLHQVLAVWGAGGHSWTSVFQQVSTLFVTRLTDVILSQRASIRLKLQRVPVCVLHRAR